MNKNYSISTYKPRKYSRLECRIFNLIARRRIQFSINVGTLEALLCLTFDGQTLPYRGMAPLSSVDLAFEARDEVWQVCLEKTRCLYELIEMGDDSRFFTDTPPESLPREVLWAVVEAFLGQGVSRVEQALQSPVKIVAPVHLTPMEGFNIPFELVFNDKEESRTHGFFQVPLNQASVELLETIFAGFPLLNLESEALAGLKIGVFFEAGSVLLPLKELKAMEKGDVLIPDLWYPDEGGIVVSIPPNRFMCEYDRETLTLAVKTSDGYPELLSGRDLSLVSQILPDHPLTDKNHKLEKENMTQEDIDVETTGRKEVKGVEDLDLTLVFEIGRTFRTLAQINELTKGAVMELPGKIEEGVPVDIKVNDQVIARGKIVGIGESLGVQITHQAGA
ncbi:MAG: FliM/FliN family flagellar motor switch protein [Desulfobacterium sp.]|jgi:type III secretion system YscQ/HrcQ family protein|nr:FliM/FliN family flagellar motor switch protein [Desulfobacterium sp.]